MTPIPEPAGDIRAQLAAVLDPLAPKRAVFLVPEDAVALQAEMLRAAGVYVVERPEGTLVTQSDELAAAFRAAPADMAGFDTAMAAILDYPEAKPVSVARCGSDYARRVRAVQARDADGHVVQECFVSPAMFLPAIECLQQHVPDGGRLVFTERRHGDRPPRSNEMGRAWLKSQIGHPSTRVILLPHQTDGQKISPRTV